MSTGLWLEALVAGRRLRPSENVQETTPRALLRRVEPGPARRRTRHTVCLAGEQVRAPSTASLALGPGRAGWLALCVLLALGACYRGHEGGAPALDEDVEVAESTGWGDAEDDVEAERDDGSTGAVADDPPLPSPAREISVVRVEANQGVAVELGAAPADSDVPLITGRKTLIRAFWEIEPTWSAREVDAELLLVYPDGTGETIVRRRFVDQASTHDTLDGSFAWVLAPELVRPGMRYAIELFEAEIDGTVDPATPSNRVPSVGTAAITLAPGQQRIRVTLVPFRHHFDGCQRQPPTDLDTVMSFVGALEASNPVQGVDLVLHPTELWTGPMPNFTAVLERLIELRTDEDADPNMYYYGLVFPCDGGESGVGGRGYVPNGPTVENGTLRTSMGRWYANNRTAALSHFVHEIGHNQGRRHVPCTGNEANPDLAYPHEGGVLARWGFGIHDWTLHPPGETFDYMSYCHPRAPSDYTWKATLEIIEELTSWSYDRPPAEVPRTTLLVGSLRADGTQVWWTMLGPANVDGTHEIELRGGGRRLGMVSAARYVASDETTVLVVAPVGTLLDGADSLVYDDGLVRREIGIADVRGRP